MAQQTINASDVLNTGRTKINENFTEVYGFGKIRGGFNGNGTDIYPSEGAGSGNGGAISPGDYWHETSGTANNTEYGGTVPIKTLYIALTALPGSDPANWRLI